MSRMIFPRLARALPALAALAALVVVAACGPAGSTSSATEAGTSAATKADAPAKTPAGDELPHRLHRFGQRAWFEDGSTLKVSKPRPFTRDEFAAAGGEKFKHQVKVTIVFKNNTKRVFDPTLTTVKVRSGDTDGEQIFQEGLMKTPENKLLPGRSVKWSVGFGVASPKRVTFTVSMGLLYADAVYTNES